MQSPKETGFPQEEAFLEGQEVVTLIFIRNLSRVG
jgi:hypothetical protein